MEIDDRCKNDKYDLIPLTPGQQTDHKTETEEVCQEAQIFDREKNIVGIVNRKHL